MFFKDMMDLQENHFKTFLKIFMETTNKRVDNLVKDFTEYKQSLDYTQVDMQKKDRGGASQPDRWSDNSRRPTQTDRRQVLKMEGQGGRYGKSKQAKRHEHLP